MYRTLLISILHFERLFSRRMEKLGDQEIRRRGREERVGEEEEEEEEEEEDKKCLHTLCSMVRRLQLKMEEEEEELKEGGIHSKQSQIQSLMNSLR